MNNQSPTVTGASNALRESKPAVSHSLPPFELFGLQLYEADRGGGKPNRIIAELVTEDWGYADPCPEPPEQHRNAAFICLAVNNHAALVAALEQVHAMLNQPVQFTATRTPQAVQILRGDCASARKAIETALAQAGGAL